MLPADHFSAGTRISAWDSVFQNALDLGILTVVAAGNENLNASERWPASSPAAFAIGNMNSTNGRQNNSPTSDRIGVRL